MEEAVEAEVEEEVEEAEEVEEGPSLDLILLQTGCRS